MKTNFLLALLFISAVIFWVTGGGALFDLGGTATGSANLPDTIEPPNSTFMGSAQENPYAQQPSIGMQQFGQ